MSVILISLIWGFAEATLFFIVPDVFITFVALKDIRSSVIASVFSALGAIPGGMIMYIFGKKYPESSIRVINKIPAVPYRIIQDVEKQLKTMGYKALFIGTFTGKPYKIYGVLSGKLNFSFPLFLLVSFPARIVRFILLGITVGFISDKVKFFFPYELLVIIHITCWTIFYIFFFYKMR
jgi:membrane protein YqaA with SNARE-associated domain